MYVDDFSGKYAPYLSSGSLADAYGDFTQPSGSGPNGYVGIYWSSRLIPYYHLNWTNAASHCPGYKGPITGPHPAGRYGSYGYNVCGSLVQQFGVSLGNLGLCDSGYFDSGHAAISEAQVKVPSEMIAMADSYYINELGGIDIGAGGGLLGGATILDPARHGKTFNQVYCDGHVGAMPSSVLFNRTNSATLWNRDHQPHPEYW